MKKNFTAIICTVCALLCAFSLAACGGGGGSGWTTTGTLTKDDDGNVVFDKVQIELRTVVSGEDLQPFTGLIEKFNLEYRGKINVNCVNLDQGRFDNEVPNQIANRTNAPDFIMSHQMGHKMYLNNKLIQPFDEAMELSGISIDLNDLSATVAPNTSLDTADNVYSIGVDAQSAVILYNKKMLAELNKQVPTTRAEFIAACEAAATQKQITPIAVSTRHTSFQDYVFPTAYIANGGSLYDSDYHASWYKNETNRAAMKNAIKSIRELTTHNPQLMRDNDSEAVRKTAYLNDKALFTIVQPWLVNTYLDDYTTTNNTGSTQKTMDEYIGAMSISKMFALDPTAAYADKIFTYSHAFAMTTAVSDINKKAAILEFIKWFTQNTNNAKAWAQAGHISMFKSVNANTAYADDPFIKDYMKKFYPNVDKLVGLGVIPASGRWQTNFGQIMIDAIQNNTDAQDETIIEKYQNEYNKYLDLVQ